MTINNNLSRRKLQIRALAQNRARTRPRWIERHKYFFEQEWSYLRYLVPARKRILDLGCGTGDLLNALNPSDGIGIDFSDQMIAQGRAAFPQLSLMHGDVERLSDVSKLKGTFDIIILSDTIGALDDCLQTLIDLHAYCRPETRIVIVYRSPFWEPFSSLYSRVFGNGPSPPLNRLSSKDIANLLNLANFDVIKREWRLLCPFRLLGLGTLINRFVATLPLVRFTSIRSYVVARPAPVSSISAPSVSIVIPCRNERGNIEAAVRRIPRFATEQEIIFVEGGSNDGTWEEIQRVKDANGSLDIKALKQPGSGKGDAVQAGFAIARGDVLMVLDGDLTMPPEELTKFYDALRSGKGEFINGSRLVYPMDEQAMRLLNQMANQGFAVLFTYLLNERYTDTLCGTKVLLRRDYEDIARNRHYFGHFDPFGDFDLIFGASKLNLKTAEVPIRYASRTYGETKISRFRHGWLLLRMAWFAYLRMKAM